MSAIFHKIVHLDLKGAPWQAEFLAQVIKVVKKWGATGILFEWEDTFPFTGQLTFIGSQDGTNQEGLYSQEDILFLLSTVKEEGLVPIQLVQTIGHMEYVLKHPQLAHLRELPQSPAVICPSTKESMALVQGIISQILNSQPTAQYIHIGADEVWHLGLCPQCRQKSESHPHGKLGLYLDHVTAIAKFIKGKKVDIIILLWDDMIRNIDESILKEYNIGSLVQPVVWNYAPVGQFQLDSNMWTRYGHVFAQSWAASAFKGANGTCQMISPVSRYASNQEAWIEEVKIYEQKQMPFGGVILTGWSRYDHYATLCELLPVSLPSLHSCLKMWCRTEPLPNECVVKEVLPPEEWPGAYLASNVHSLAQLRERILHFLNGDQICTWLNFWQIKHDYINPLQAEQISATARQLSNELASLLPTLTHNMFICGSRSKNEWVSTWGVSLKERLITIVNQANSRTVPAIAPSFDSRRPRQ